MKRASLSLLCVMLQLGVSDAVTTRGADVPPCPRCGWVGEGRGRSVVVSTFDQLARAVRTSSPDTEILLAPGDYRLMHPLEIATPRLTLRAKTGRAEDVRLRGEGMAERRVGVALAVAANDVTLADLTIGSVRHHAVQVRGERDVRRLMIHGVGLHDTGEQLLKGSRLGARGAGDVTVACSRFWYTTHAPSNYTDGVDVLAGHNWEVRDNEFDRIVGPASGRHAAGPAIMFWAGSRNIRISRNVVRDSFRGIAVGLMPPRGQVEVSGAMVQSNVVWNRHPWADEGIEIAGSKDVLVEHNTVFVEGTLPWSIGVRYPGPAGIVRNNLTNRSIIMRDGGQATLVANIVSARATWFRTPGEADLRLLPRTPAIDAGTRTDLTTDFDRRPRVHGTAPDAGAFEWRP
jgi:hypothetical protein